MRRKKIEKPTPESIQTRVIGVKGYNVEIYFLHDGDKIIVVSFRAPEDWPFDQFRGGDLVIEEARKVFKKKVVTSTEHKTEEPQPRGFWRKK